ncbi:MAG: ABC transporter ATP-binding protein [Eubacteriales bacterium]|nr:ABC transporter ATP-binding protein [Eubacteriales bacterium]
MLEVKRLTVRAPGRTLLNGVSFSVFEHDWLMVAGPNGAGKSTLVNAVSQSIAYEGEVYFEGKNAAAMKPAARARSIGVLAQSHHVAYPFTVEEVVRLGRYAYTRGPFFARTDGDEAKVEEALILTGMDARRAQSVTTLSGGELQRTFLAQVFAQDPKLLILDEPTNDLDPVYQKRVFELISAWVKLPGRAVMSVVHDLALAKAYGTRALLLSEGGLAAEGETDTALSRENLNRVYAVDVYAWMRELLEKWTHK